MIISISYDLNRPGQDYQDLYKTIKQANSWAHLLESLWFIQTHETVNAWSDKLQKQVDGNDHLFLVDITGKPCQGWMNKEMWDWLDQHKN
jgi:hypothetical protein